MGSWFSHPVAFGFLVVDGYIVLPYYDCLVLKITGEYKRSLQLAELGHSRSVTVAPDL
jgi:hypothetical protein